MQSEKYATGWLILIVTSVFVILKLMGQLDWSWWEVTLPLWLPILLCSIFVAALAALGFVTALFRMMIKMFDERTKKN